MRPLGGWLADRIGGAQVLSWVFGGVAGFALLLAWPSMIPFTVGALGCAALLGLGNGAVFKLVPERFPRDTGTVTGLVGALGGLGGFFPPLLLGVFRDRLGVLWPGFVLLSLTALLLRVANQRVFHPADVAWRAALPAAARQAVDRVRAGAWAARLTLLLAAAIVVGSRNLAHFDAALVGYTFATLFAVVRHHLSLRDVDRSAADADVLAARLAGVLREARALPATSRGWPSARRVDVAANRFIFARSRCAASTHWLIMWGCLLAAAITFPLVWGWVHFETVPGDIEMYRTFVFGVAGAGFPGRFAARVRDLSRPGVGVVPGHRRRDAGVPPPHDRSRRRGDAAVRAGHPAAAAAVCDQRDRADADGRATPGCAATPTSSSRCCTR